jgi:acyl-[acyl-carrier-protein] desaturase
MDSELQALPSEREVLMGLDDFVAENLSLLLPIEKAWQPTDYLPDLTKEDWREQVQKLRAPAAELTDDVLVVLVADMITEEALPSYSVALSALAEDYTGVADKPWSRWLRGWTAEENRHGDLLNAYLRLSGRVDMRSVEVTIHNLLNGGFSPGAYPNLYGGLVYTSFQERATKVCHNNVGKLAANHGDQALARICQRIAGDEARHETFYTTVMNRVIDQDPNGGLIVFSAMLRKMIAMPGKLMTDGKDPNLFQHFAAVAQRLGVYTVEHYAQIVEHLVGAWDVSHRVVRGKASRAQDFICHHAEVCREYASRMAENPAPIVPVSFSWVFGRMV